MWVPETAEVKGKYIPYTEAQSLAPSLYISTSGSRTTIRDIRRKHIMRRLQMQNLPKQFKRQAKSFSLCSSKRRSASHISPKRLHIFLKAISIFHKMAILDFATDFLWYDDIVKIDCNLEET